MGTDKMGRGGGWEVYVTKGWVSFDPWAVTIIRLGRGQIGWIILRIFGVGTYKDVFWAYLKILRQLLIFSA